MQSANGRTSAELQDADVPEGPQLGQFVGEMQHAVDHRVLGKESTRALGVGQENHRAPGQIGQRLNLVQELLELPIGRRRFLRGDEAIDDEQRRLVLLDGAANQASPAPSSPSDSRVL